jgi:hypothetical protein
MKTTPKITTDELIARVIRWAEEKNITGPFGQGRILKQLDKTQEELNETRDAVWKLILAPEEYSSKMIVDVVYEIGDILVTVIIAADMLGLTVNECLSAAEYKNSSRTGRMVDGVFVKNAPVTEPCSTNDEYLN